MTAKRRNSRDSRRWLQRGVRRPDTILARPGVVLVFLDVIHAWDIGWHCGHRWWSRTYGHQYPVIFWINLPVEEWMTRCLRLPSSKDRLVAVRLGIADAFWEKSKRQPKSTILEASRLCARESLSGHTGLQLPLFGLQPKHSRLACRQYRNQSPLESYLHAIYGPYCEIAPRSPNDPKLSHADGRVAPQTR
jgi:hypothetical protein